MEWWGGGGGQCSGLIPKFCTGCLRHFPLTQGNVGHHGGHRERVSGEVHQVVHEPFYWPWDTSFLPSFLIGSIKNTFKYLRDMLDRMVDVKNE